MIPPKRLRDAILRQARLLAAPAPRKPSLGAALLRLLGK